MAANVGSVGYNLILLLCFALTAYIFYFLGSHNAQSRVFIPTALEDEHDETQIPHPVAPSSPGEEESIEPLLYQEPHQALEPPAYTAGFIPPATSSFRGYASNAAYEYGFEDGVKIASKFNAADLRRERNNDRKERKKLEMAMARTEAWARSTGLRVQPPRAEASASKGRDGASKTELGETMSASERRRVEGMNTEGVEAGGQESGIGRGLRAWFLGRKRATRPVVEEEETDRAEVVDEKRDWSMLEKC